MNEKVICVKTYTYHDVTAEFTFKKGEIYKLHPFEDFSRKNSDSVFVCCDFNYYIKPSYKYEGIRFYYKNTRDSLKLFDYFRKYELKEERKDKLKNLPK